MSIRLYLSSQGLGDDPQQLRPLSSDANSARIVLNALDPYQYARTGALQAMRDGLGALGYDCEELDLRDYFHAAADTKEQTQLKNTQLTALLARSNLIWATGGNTFVLAKAMTQARFGTALLLANHERTAANLAALTYGGDSAGAVVTGIDLQGIDLMDDPEMNPAGYAPATKALTLGLIDNRIVPHFRSDNPESARAEEAVAFLEQRNLKHKTLPDGQVWVSYSP